MGRKAREGLYVFFQRNQKQFNMRADIRLMRVLCQKTRQISVTLKLLTSKNKYEQNSLAKRWRAVFDFKWL